MITSVPTTAGGEPPHHWAGRISGPVKRNLDVPSPISESACPKEGFLRGKHSVGLCSINSLIPLPVTETMTLSSALDFSWSPGIAKGQCF